MKTKMTLHKKIRLHSSLIEDMLFISSDTYYFILL